jgi:hypothetical protein
MRDFNRVSLTGVGTVIVTQSNEESLTVEAEVDIVPYIKTEVRAGTLVLGFTDKAKEPGFHVSGPIKFYLKMKEIVGLDIFGIGEIRLPSLETNELEIVVGLGGSVSIGSLTAEKLLVQLVGRANVDVEGEVVEQDIRLAGGAYNGAKLQSQATSVDVKDLGSAAVFATETLDVRISGGGSVDYYGHPRVAQNVTGRGTLNSLGEPQ